MKIIGAKIAVFMGCVVLFLGLVAGTASANQTKTKKNTKAENASIAAYNPLDLNRASEQELENLPGIGSALAKKIVANRPYSSVSELSKASVPARTIKKIKPMVTVGSAPAGEANSSASKKSSDLEGSSNSIGKASNTPRTEQAAGGDNGKVWVNTKSGVYHKEGDRWYGKTKKGKYMTEDEAIKAGYRADKEKQAQKKE